jgi:hypothetical protein
MKSKLDDCKYITYKKTINGKETAVLTFRLMADGDIGVWRRPGRGRDAEIGYFGNFEQAIRSGLEDRFDGIPGWYSRVVSGNVPGAFIITPVKRKRYNGHHKMLVAA